MNFAHRQVGTLKSMCLSTMKQNSDSNEQGEVKDTQSKSSVIVENGADPASTSKQNVAPTAPSMGPRSEGEHSTGDGGERVKAPASFSAESVTTATPLQSPMSAPNRTSSEDGFLSTPEAKSEPRDVVMKHEINEKARTERADHLSLNEFLISELEVYCSRLLGREYPKKTSSGVSDLARVTGQQLYQDHQRALMDFDDEWKR